MEKHGLAILRFSNNEIETDIEKVLKTIEKTLKDRVQNLPPPTTDRPSGEGRGGGSQGGLALRCRYCRKVFGNLIFDCGIKTMGMSESTTAF